MKREIAGLVVKLCAGETGPEEHTIRGVTGILELEVQAFNSSAINLQLTQTSTDEWKHLHQDVSCKIILCTLHLKKLQRVSENVPK